jgi:penicillin-binding protein 1A
MSIRGDYDRDRIARKLAPVRRAWKAAVGGFEHTDRPPSETRTVRGRLHQFGLAVGVIALCAALVAVLAIPGVAFIGRVVDAVAGRFAEGPAGKLTVPQIAQRSVIVDARGGIIATLAGEQNRRVIPLAEIPLIVRQAVLAIEDARFYQHRGIDAQGLFRALVTNAKSGRLAEGGSTITQQLVKNLFVGSEKSLDRKIREAQYAIALENSLTKDQILELYLNEAYFGEGAYGIAAASEFYYGKPAAKLAAYEAALLAGIIRSPENTNPFDDKAAATQRRNVVLKRMLDEHFIKQADYAKFTLKPLGAARHPLPPFAEPYFVEFIKAQILDDARFGATRQERAIALFQGGLRIETTLDLKLQQAGSRAVSEVLNLPKDPSSALVSIDPKTGRVKTMVGGRDFGQSKYNLAVQGTRPTGSTFKPYVLAAALEKGVPPGLTLDTPSPIELTDDNGQVWRPANYSEHGEGIITLRRATELSVNTFYAQLIKRIGPQSVVEMANKLGITAKLKPYLSLTLGTFDVSPFDMASAYGTFANQGIHCRPYAITRVTNPTGKVILRNEPDCKRVLDAAIANQVNDILVGVVERGTGRRSGRIPGRITAGKTGTTDNYADAWFVGYTPQFSTAVWMGFKDSTKQKLHNIHGYRKVCGGCLPAQIWNKYMRAANQGLPVEKWPAPPAVQHVAVPNVVGETLDDAKRILEDAGFTVRQRTVVAALAPGTVAAQSPGGGATVEAGAMITLDVSDGTGNEPEPSPHPILFGAARERRS